MNKKAFLIDNWTDFFAAMTLIVVVVILFYGPATISTNQVESAVASKQLEIDSNQILINYLQSDVSVTVDGKAEKMTFADLIIKGYYDTDYIDPLTSESKKLLDSVLSNGEGECSTLFIKDYAPSYYLKCVGQALCPINIKSGSGICPAGNTEPVLIPVSPAKSIEVRYVIS